MQSFRTQRFHWSLRWALLVPFGLVSVASIALMAFAHNSTIVYMSAQEADSLLRANNEHADAQLRLLLETPFQLQRMTAEHIVSAKLVRQDDLQPLESYLRMLFEQVYRNDLRSIDMVQIGTVYGDFVAYSEKTSRGEKRLYHEKSRKTGHRLVVSDVETGEVQRSRDVYDPRKRPWYTLAAEAREPRWTPLYAASTNPFGIGIAATFPVLGKPVGPNGKPQLLGILGSDLSLTSMVDVLRKAPLPGTYPSALSYIVDDQGNLVAVSDGSRLVEVLPGEEKPRLRQAATSSNKLISQSYVAVRDEAKLERVVTVQINGADHVLMATRFQDPRGIDWRIVSVVPEDTLSGSSLRSAQLALALSLLLAALGLILGFIVIHRTAKPFRQTAQEAATLTVSESIDDTPPLLPPPSRSRITEARQLTQAFRTMAQRIAQQVQHLKEIALKDSVTGLLNLRGLLAAADWSDEREVALVALGVDDYQLVLATLHAAADAELLSLLAKRLSARVPAPALRARGEGAMFLFLLFGRNAEQLEQQLVDLQQAFVEPLRTGSDELLLHASIGVASARCTGAAVGSHLHGEATLALAAARRAGSGGAPVHFDRSLFTTATSNTRLLNELGAAIEQKELMLHYQPVVDLASERIVGMEALVRWPHPERGMVPPSDFIPLAEESGLILALGSWVLEQAAHDFEQLLNEGTLPPQSFVNVNVSVRQMLQSDFVDRVRSLLERHALPTGSLKIELTESLLLQDNASVRNTIQGLQKLGVPLVLDDFGTGYSSLSYLTRLRFSTIKVDRSLLLSAAESQAGRTILKAAIDLARGLNAQCVVEGVEDDEQVALLRAVSATLAQGYYFARPLPLDALQRLLQEGR